MITSLAETLREAQPEIAPVASDWIQYIYDHRFIFILASTYERITLEEQHKYRYRPHEWFSMRGIKSSLVWLNLMLNDLHTPREFNGVDGLYIFNSDDILDRVKMSFDTWRHNQVELNEELALP